MGTWNISGNIVDGLQRTIFPGTIVLADSRIQAIQHEAVARDAGYILPGLVDAHVHIESSMLVPSESARLATVHGTVAMVSDPHAIANVLGLPGCPCQAVGLHPQRALHDAGVHGSASLS
jgi:adenine deaminase